MNATTSFTNAELFNFRACEAGRPLEATMTNTTATKKYKYSDIVEYDGDVWTVLGVGYTREDGKTYLHLASTTRFITQKNGKRPIQACDWI